MLFLQKSSRDPEMVELFNDNPTPSLIAAFNVDFLVGQESVDLFDHSRGILAGTISRRIASGEKIAIKIIEDCEWRP